MDLACRSLRYMVIKLCIYCDNVYMYVYYFSKYLLYQANKNRASSLKNLEVYYGTRNT